MFGERKIIIIAATTLLLLLTMLKVNGQSVVTELNGFQIGQYRETATNELGKPVQDGKFEDGFEYEAFIINEEESLYIVFEYAAGYTDIIWSIQISGNDISTDIGFKGLKLGVDKKEVERILGRPDDIEDIGEYGERWSYDSANYSVEISKDGFLSSVKIIDNYSEDVPKADKLPKFADFVKLLNSKNNAEIAGILAPGIVIYHNSQTLFFGKSIKTEIETDYSKVFQTIRKISKGLDKINTSDENEYEENMRITIGENAKHVIKIKSGHTIREIVSEYINGEYFIRGINTK